MTRLHVPTWGGEQAAAESKKNKNVNREEKSGVRVWRRKGKREKEKRKKKIKKERKKERKKNIEMILESEMYG